MKRYSVINHIRPGNIPWNVMEEYENGEWVSFAEIQEEMKSLRSEAAKARSERKMTINIFENTQEQEQDPRTGSITHKNWNKSSTITISDKEILMLLAKFLASKKEVVIDLLKDKA